MQTTLLGLAIAIILALVSALVAPLVVDWNHYRATVEAEATRLTGTSVRVRGRIDARILPSPVITLRDVEVGDTAQPQLRAGTLRLELRLGALLRGEVRATEVSLIAPQVSLALDRSGALAWPKPSPSFRPDSLSISRFNVEDGRVVLTDARSDARIVLSKLWFAGDIRSLLGPFRGEGAFVVDDELYGYRLSGSRADDAGTIKVKLGLDPSDHPLTTDIEGTLAFDQGVPQFEGTWTVARPAGATLANGQRVMSEPWHAGGAIKASTAAVAVHDVIFQYGPEERALNLTGDATLTFGEHPHFDGAIAALQIDVDRVLAAPDLTHQPPLVAIRSFFQAFVTAAKLPVPGQVHVGVNAVTVGGATLQSLRADVQFDRTGWSLGAFEFRAPGMTQVSLSGRLTDTPHGFAFSGPGTLDSADADMLVAWFKGRSERPSGQARTLSAHGDVTIASDRIAVERLAAALDQENVEGRLAYTWPMGDRPAALDADLRAAELDLDALANFATTAAGSDGFAMPQQGELALDVGTVTFAGVDARAVRAQIKFDAGRLHIGRLSIGDLRGAKLEISGRIDELSSRPRGQVTVSLDARALDGLSGMAAKFAPQLADALHRLADRLAPAQIHAVLNLEQAAAASTARLHLDGSLAAMRVTMDGEATGEPAHLGDAVLRLDSRLDADDGTALVGLLGLDRILAVDQLPGRLTLSATGPLDGDLHVDGQVAASGLDAAVQGALRLNGGQAPTGALRVMVSAGDLRPLQQLMTGQAGDAVPVSGRAALTVDGAKVSLTDIALSIGKSSLRGRLAVSLSSPVGIEGGIEADNVDAASAMALLFGLPGSAAGSNASWSGAPIGVGAFNALNGSVTFKLDHARLTPALIVEQLTGTARFQRSEIALDDLDGTLAGGHLSGALLVGRDQTGLSAHARADLAGANAAAIAGPALNVADGRLTVTWQCDGAGASPAELVGSLHGNSAITLTDAHFAGLDVAAFAAAIRAADQSGATIDLAKVQSVVAAAMSGGRLAVPQGHADAMITLGRLNLSRVILPAENDAELALDGSVDLAAAAIDLRMAISEPPPASALINMRPEILMIIRGPLAAPQRVIDVSALTSWLALRAAELQTRRLESMQADRHDAEIAPIARPAPAAVRILPSGTVVESSLPSNLTPPIPGARGIERLQPPPLPPAAPDQNHSGGPAAAPKPATTAAPMNRPAPQPTPPPAAPPPPASSNISPGRSVLDFLFGSH